MPTNATKIQTKTPLARGRTIGQACLSLFNRTSLRDNAALDTAVSTLDHYLADPRADIYEAVSVIRSVKYLLEFILCVASDDAFARLTIGITQSFPSTSEEFVQSVAANLLSDFSVSLLLPYERSSDAPAELVARRRSVEQASSALQAISYLISSDAFDDDQPKGSKSRWAAKNQDRQQRKTKPAHSGRGPAVNLQPILEYGADVPASKVQAAQLAEAILAKQSKILQAYLKVFRNEDTISHFRKMFLPQTSPIARGALPAEDDMTMSSPLEHPHAQPKSALFLENADGFGEWGVQISTRAERDLRRARNEDARTFDDIVNKVRDLSNGYFSKDNHKRLAGSKLEVPIYEAKTTRDSRVVYQIHCTPDYVSRVERQVIRIFRVYTHAQIDERFWEYMSKQLASKGSEYRRRCIQRNQQIDERGDPVVLPKQFPCMIGDTDDISPSTRTSPSSVSASMSRKDAEEIHNLLALEKFVILSQGFLNGILADQDVAHVFELSAREQEILNHTSSCFVLGRSGTGKTTTMLFKILSVECTWNMLQASKPRQLFVTKSEVLAQKVEEYYVKLHQSIVTANLSPAEVEKLAAAAKQTRRQAWYLVDADEEVYFDDAFPTRYGDLEDRHFPLFLTYDHLCRLLENEFRHLVLQDKVQQSKAALLRDVLRMGRSTRTRPQMPDDSWGAVIDYDRFRENYMSHLRETSLSADMLFGEFMGVIKGSEQALKRSEGSLDKESYCNISRHTQTTSDDQRKAIYKLFEIYTKRKKENSQYDLADRTRSLIRSLEIVGVPGHTLDFIYVDEAQDNLLIDALVLKKLCGNPHGMFWAGDTAQTISAGSTFSFDELRAFMYRLNKEDSAPSLAAQRARPETFHLTTNYRSHSGIVDTAHFVVQLIMKYWPDAIDRLPPEKGMRPGPGKPIFFGECDSRELQRALFSDASSGVSIEFGARQCILVRDEAAKKRLREQVGKGGQILTIYQSKGLEFDDVLIYNFFEDSLVDYKQWHNLMNDNNIERRYPDVCRELKRLYVAITRARMNLWISDCSQSVEPLRLLLVQNGLVDIHDVGKPIPRLAVSSSKEEWADAARSMFQKRQYSEAMLNFERAGLPREQQVAYAYVLRDEAYSAPATGNARGKLTYQASAFGNAAEAFISAAQSATGRERRTYYRIAGECFVRRGNHSRAGSAFYDAEEYTLAAQHYRKAGSFDEAVEVVKSHQDKVSSDVAQSIIDVSRLYYIKEDKLADARKLFEDDEKVLDYMDNYGLDAPRASLLEDLERFDEAAECHLHEGNLLEAIRLFCQQSLSRAAECILDGLWRFVSLGASDENLHDPMVLSLMEHAYGIERRVDEKLRDELAMFRGLYEQDLPTLAQLGDVFHYDHRNLAAALVCYDRVFSHDFKLEEADLSEIGLCFKAFLNYARILQRFACDPDPCNSPSIQKLFAFQSTNDELFLVPRQGFLSTQCNPRDTPGMRETDNGLLIPRWELKRLIKNVLKERLQERVWNQNEASHLLRRLQPCFLFAVQGSCPRRECYQYHIAINENRAEVYNIFIRIHVLQIMIFHTLYATDICFKVLFKQQRTWLRRLYEALYPAHSGLGSMLLLSVTSIPELSEDTAGRSIIAVWLQNFLNRLRPEPALPFLANLMRATRLAMVFDQRAAVGSLQRIPCAVRGFDTSQNLFRPTHEGQVNVVGDLITFAEGWRSDALDKGILFLNHVIATKLLVDLDVLCDFMDHLCGSMLAAMRLRDYGSLHGLTLPRSWIVRILSNLDQVEEKTMELSTEYTHYIGQLLSEIYSGVDAGHLLCGDKNMCAAGLNRSRALYVERICKNLGGFNNTYWRTKEDVRKAIFPLRNAGRRIIDPTVSAYIYAQDWAGIMRAVQLSTIIKSGVDEMVELWDRNINPQSSFANQTHGHTRRVVYNRTDEIVSLLRAENVIEHFSKLSTMTNRSFHNATEFRAGADDIDAQADSSDGDAKDYLGLSKEERSAAKIVVIAYRGYVERKSAEKDMQTEVKQRVYTSFRTQSRAMQWPTRLDVSYRLLFLGVVPQLFFVIECLADHLHRSKSAAKARLRTEDHDQLENVETTLNEVTQSLKETHRLRDALSPRGSVHGARDVHKLSELALALESLVDRVDAEGDESASQWRGEVQDAVRRIHRSPSYQRFIVR